MTIMVMMVAPQHRGGGRQTMSDDGEHEYDGDVAYTKLKTAVKRGTGTRDEDKTKLVTRHPEPRTAVMRHAQALGQFEALARDARAVQPEETADE
jgi:hypothetical protein